MRHLLSAVLAACAACSSPGPDTSATSKPTVQQRAVAADADGVAYFAGGCFWGVEHYMQQLEGVISVESGYMGGHLDEPSYEDVTGHESGHLEAVEVRFDPRVVSYEQVAKRFFEIHDPTQANGQGPDIGSQYLSAVFYTSDDQREATQSLIAKLEARGYDVVTDVRPAARFWPAEDYHQDYYARSGKQPYCHARVKRFGD
jgi:peptide methionine sulfoxide reductase msrA/msrB